MLLTVIVLFAAALCLIFQTTSEVAVAEVYVNFLEYNGSLHGFKAGVRYDGEITSLSEAEDFKIVLYEQYLEWSIFGPNLQVTITLERPDGSKIDHVLEHNGYLDKSDFDFEETLFTSSDLKNSNGEYIGGTYTVRASGYIVVDLQKQQNQNNSFTFSVNLPAPTVTMTAGSALDNYGITNKDVTVTASNTDSTPTLKYSRSSSNAYPTTATTSFTNGKVFTEEGNYIVTATDSRNKTTTRYFSIDKTAPTLSLSGVSNGGFTNEIVKATWSTAVGGVGAQLVNSDDTLRAKYSRTTGTSFPTSATKSYYGSRLAAEGNYLMTITDKAGNTTSYSFTIDTTAPTLTISGLVKGEVTKDGFSASWSTAVGAGSNIANNRDALTVKYGVAASDYPSSASTTYSKQNTFLSNEGYYLMTIEDKAGNRSKYRVIVDQTAPAVSAPAEWLNTAFTYSASDPRGVTIEYRSNSGATGKVERTSYSVSQSVSNYGVWQFRAIDDVGNTTGWSTVNFYYRETFGNKVNIQNAYKTPAYWTVQLSEKNYPDIAGRYSFASYESALAFAVVVCQYLERKRRADL